MDDLSSNRALTVNLDFFEHFRCHRCQFLLNRRNLLIRRGRFENPAYSLTRTEFRVRNDCPGRPPNNTGRWSQRLSEASDQREGPWQRADEFGGIEALPAQIETPRPWASSYGSTESPFQICSQRLWDPSSE
jgi:hypothetical protein